MSKVKKIEILAGNVFINPTFKFDGVSYENSGHAKSNVTDYLPYLLSGYRFTDRVVLGVNITPSGYGHLNWPVDSIVSKASTLTDVLYYRFGLQSSYQFTDALTLGVGLNLENNGQYQLNFVIPGQGNQVNSITGLNYTGDLGLYYKIDSKNHLTLAGYSKVDTYGQGHSTSDTTTVNNLALNITEAPVIYIGLEHFVDDQWFLEGKIYWSGWSIQKNLNFINSTTGSYVVPTDWKDVWSFQLTTRYATTKKLALLGSIIYETNPVPLTTNAIGYPLAASGAISAGLDVTLQEALSSQVLYSYGRFLPNSPIDNIHSKGTITANFQAIVIQLSYKT